MLLLASSILLVSFSGPRNSLTQTNVSAATPALLEVWNPVLHSSNITDPSITVGSQFTVNVNVTGAGPINAFQVTLAYNVMGLRVISATSSTLAGGSFGSSPGPGCTIFTLQNSIFDLINQISVAAQVNGPCSVNGNNAQLFSVTFNVLKANATTIDIVQTDDNGKFVTLISHIDQAVPFTAADAYFRNTLGNPPGTPPIAVFTYSPGTPVRGDTVSFDASASVDPDNSTLAGRGIRGFFWIWGDGTLGSKGAINDHTFTFPPTLPAYGNFTVTLVVWDFEGLMARKSQIVYVSQVVVHDISVQVSLDRASYNVGDPANVTVAISNRGNRNEEANLTVIYDYQGSTQLGSESYVSVLQNSQAVSFKYRISTSNLPARAYTVTARVVIVYNNSTGHGEIPDENTINNIATATFTLVGASTASFISLPLIGGISVAAIVIAYAVVRLMRRRKAEE